MTKMTTAKAIAMFKKEAQAEGIEHGSFRTMKAWQENGLFAKVILCDCRPYETCIANEEYTIDTFSRPYGAWTEEERARVCERAENNITYFEDRRATYKNRANEAKALAEAIINSQAYKNLALRMGIKEATIETPRSEFTPYHLRLTF